MQALTPGHSFTWWVAAVGGNGTRGPWSNGQNFSLAALATPVPAGPSGTGAAGVGFDTPTFSWTSSVGTTRSYLWVTDTTTGKVVIQIPNATGNAWTTGTAQALTPGHNYTWWVAATSTNGSQGHWSAGQNFSLAAPAAPTMRGPAAAGVTPTFAWNAVAGAASYVIWVDDQTTGQSQALLVSNVQATAWVTSAAQALKSGHRYVWWVGAVAANGKTTSWSGSAVFTTP